MIRYEKILRVACVIGSVASIAGMSLEITESWAQSHAGQSRERLLALEGGQNFRDLGGYPTLDGRKVRWGVLYRAGSMDQLTPGDYSHVAKLGLQSAFDFRSQEERVSRPVRWPDNARPVIYEEDYSMASAGFDLRDAKNWSREQTQAFITSLYPKMLEGFRGQYGQMFDVMISGGGPLMFYCSAGKDRTGIAAALILTALDVPRDVIVEDYLLSNRYFDAKRGQKETDAVADAWGSLPPEVVERFSSVDRSYIEEIFKVLDTYPGGPRGYLHDRLGLSDEDIKTLKSRYTE